MFMAMTAKFFNTKAQLYVAIGQISVYYIGLPEVYSIWENIQFAVRKNLSF